MRVYLLFFAIYLFVEHF